jgi:hypothetical protein
MAAAHANSTVKSHFLIASVHARTFFSNPLKSKHLLLKNGFSDEHYGQVFWLRLFSACFLCLPAFFKTVAGHYVDNNHEASKPLQRRNRAGFTPGFPILSYF